MNNRPSSAGAVSKVFFLKQYLLAPLGIGSVTPSSRKLAQFMIKNMELQPGDTVVELGPGTGVFTRELLFQGVNPANLILIEFNAQFVGFLKAEFPKVNILQGDAGELPQILKDFGRPTTNKIISGIPLRSMKPAQRDQIAKAMAGVLVPGGKLVQFSYFPAAPVPNAVAADVGLAGHRAGLVLRNVPPAFVWQYSKAR